MILAVVVGGCASVPQEPSRGRFDARGLEGRAVPLVRAAAS